MIPEGSLAIASSTARLRNLDRAVAAALIVNAYVARAYFGLAVRSQATCAE